jgi:hypothetical protein
MKCLIEDGEFGKRLIVQEGWNDELEEFARTERIAELALRSVKGWQDNDLNFLPRLPWLEAIDIQHLTIGDLSPLRGMGNLVVLSLDTPRAKIVPDFSALQRLRMFVLAYWMPGSESAFNCLNLERLLIYKYPYEDITALSRLRKLDSLSFLNTYRLKSVRGIRALQKMEYLGFFLCPKLTDIAEIAELRRIKELAFDTCKKARPFDVVGGLNGLQSLAFCNCGPIESVAALRNTPELEEFYFIESTDVRDGDLSAVASLPKLRSCFFKGRKHYSHDRAFFEQRGAIGVGHGGPRKRFGTFPHPNYEPLGPDP